MGRGSHSYEGDENDTVVYMYLFIIQYIKLAARETIFNAR
jgi:hypothetical protein